MKRRLLRRTHQEPSLVPLADMLSNTVGITIFILIFTVLASGGAVIPKCFPIEQKTEKKPIIYVCTGNTILTEEVNKVSDTFFKDKINQLIEELKVCISKRVRLRSDWITDYNNLTAVTNNFTVKTLGSISSQSLTLLISLEPLANVGEAVATLQTPESCFLRELSSQDPKEQFVFFMVCPDSLEVFASARKLAREKGYGVGWAPIKKNSPLRISLTGGGGLTPEPQDLAQ